MMKLDKKIQYICIPLFILLFSLTARMVQYQDEINRRGAIQELSDLYIEVCPASTEMILDYSGTEVMMHSFLISDDGITVLLRLKDPVHMSEEIGSYSPDLFLENGEVISAIHTDFSVDLSTGEAKYQSAYAEIVDVENITGVRFGRIFLPLI